MKCAHPIPHQACICRLGDWRFFHLGGWRRRWSPSNTAQQSSSGAVQQPNRSCCSSSMTGGLWSAHKLQVEELLKINVVAAAMSTLLLYSHCQILPPHRLQCMLAEKELLRRRPEADYHLNSRDGARVPWPRKSRGPRSCPQTAMPIF